MSCFGLFYDDLFHTNGQLEEMLQDGYDGRQFFLKTKDNMKIDCMFFPSNKEKILTRQEMLIAGGDDNENVVVEPKYLNFPTVIYFNPNAQIY